MFAINPAVFAYTEGDAPELLLSLGTGSHTRRLPYDEVKDWGRLEWAEPIIDVVFDGSADAVDTQLQALAGDRYVRLQTRLNEASDDLDDASEENLAALRREAERLIAARDADIDRVCEILAARPRLRRSSPGPRARPACCAARAGAPRARTGPP